MDIAAIVKHDGHVAGIPTHAKVSGRESRPDRGDGQKPTARAALIAAWANNDFRLPAGIQAAVEELLSPPEASPDSQSPSTAAPSIAQLERPGITSQSSLWANGVPAKDTIVSKLESIGREDLAAPLRECATRWTVHECTQCGKHYCHSNHCDRRYCPVCQPRLARKRRAELEWWCARLPHAKHVVLTVRNSETISAERIRWLKACFGRLRRRKLAKAWQGGVYSIEVTNEGRGWHIHLHALLEAPWIDPHDLAREWAQIVGQDFAIVAVRGGSGKKYVSEVLKYAAKGSEVASWSPEDIAAFADAIQSVRLFGVFGSAYGKREEWKQAMEELSEREQGLVCVCGSTDFRTWENLDYLAAMRLYHAPPGEAARIDHDDWLEEAAAA